MNTSTYEEKIIWAVEYTNPYHHPQNWTSLFSTREAALELLEEQIEWYSSQGAIITREEEEFDEEDPGAWYVVVKISLEGENDPIGLMHIVQYHLDSGDRPLWVI